MTVEIACSICGRSKDQPLAKSGEPRLPKRWVRFCGSVYCPQCRGEAMVVRAITIPVAGPVEGTWDELRSALRAAWIESTRGANWIVTELYARDTRRQPEDEKLGKMPPTLGLLFG